MTPGVIVLLAASASATGRNRLRGGSSWPPANPQYDVVVLGTGVKESLLSGLLATHGKRVLQLERSSELGGSAATLDLQELSDRMDGPGAELAESRVGLAEEWSIDPAPKLIMAAGRQMKLLTESGAWQRMFPPGFKRVHRSLLYRLRPDGAPDVHRVLANLEDVAKTRSLSALEKARVVQFFLWVDRYKEHDPKTHGTGPIPGLSKTSLDLNKMSAAKFLAYWELPEQAVQMVTRGMALHHGPHKRLKRVAAVELVRRIRRYKDAYKTFPHMTSPYVYPVGGLGSTLPRAMGDVLAEHGGACLTGRPVDAIAAAEGGGLSVTSAGGTVRADCVVAAPEYAEGRVAERYEIVRLYAVLNHPPNRCKDANSCQMILPAAQTGRDSDVYLLSASAGHAVAPRGKWLVVASARVEGSTRGLEALAVAKRELAAALPFLKPCKKMFAEISSYAEPLAEPPADGLGEAMHVFKSCDETCYFDSVEDDVAAMFERVTGEPLGNKRRR